MSNLLPNKVRLLHKCICCLLKNEDNYKVIRLVLFGFVLYKLCRVSSLMTDPPPVNSKTFRSSPIVGHNSSSTNAHPPDKHPISYGQPNF